MARPRRFEREEALKAATRLFWAKGYAGTSAEDLVREMGIARQSLYDVFGSKRELYLEALQAYSSGNVSDLVQILRGEKSPLAALRQVLLAPILLGADEREMGCFGINATCEFGAADPDVTGAQGGARLALGAAMEALVEEAKRSGEFPVDVETKAAIAYIGCVLAGLKVQSRGGASPEMLTPVVDLALKSLTGPKAR